MILLKKEDQLFTQMRDSLNSSKTIIKNIYLIKINHYPSINNNNYNNNNNSNNNNRIYNKNNNRFKINEWNKAEIFLSNNPEVN